MCSVGFLEDFLIWLVIVCVIIAVMRALVAFLLPRLGFGGDILALLVQIISILMYGAILIAVIVLVFALISCVGGLGFPRLH